MEQELNDLLGQLLGNPETMEKLGNVLSSFSAAPPPAAAESNGANALEGLLPLLQGVAASDDREVALLRALRPYMHDGREKRVDEAIEMLRLAKLLPLITGKRGEMPHGE